MVAGTESFTSSNGDGSLFTRTGLDHAWNSAYSSGNAVNVASNQVTTTGEFFGILFEAARCLTACDTSDNYAELDLANLPAAENRWWFVWARLAQTTADCYSFEVSRVTTSGANGSWRLVRITDNGATRVDLATGTFASALAGTEVVRVEAQGSTVRGLLDGALITSQTDTGVAAGAYTGFGGADGNSVILADNYAFGDVAVARSFPPPPAARRRLPLLVR